MADTVTIYSGNDGTPIPVAGRTLGGGEFVQQIEVPDAVTATATITEGGIDTTTFGDLDLTPFSSFTLYGLTGVDDMVMTVQQSIDGIQWILVLGFEPAGSPGSSSMTGVNSGVAMVFPVIGRYVRVFVESALSPGDSCELTLLASAKPVPIVNALIESAANAIPVSGTVHQGNAGENAWPVTWSESLTVKTIANVTTLNSSVFNAGDTENSGGIAATGRVWTLCVYGVDAGGALQPATAWDVRLEVQTDGPWYEIASHKSGVQQDGDFVSRADGPIATAFRIRCDSLTLGSADHLVVTAFVASF